MKYYNEDAESVLAELESTKDGLDGGQAAERLEKHGANKLAQPKGDSAFVRFLKQLADPMIIVLLAAALVSAVTSVYSNESPADVFIILFVVILNSILGVVQEGKAEKAIEALKTMTAQQSRVMRNGTVRTVPSEQLVPGDIILLEAGDSVPADARIIECASLQTEESALTGESVPVNKSSEPCTGGGKIPLAERHNMVYMGSSVVYGRGVAVVCDTGMNTEMGKIADALTKARDGDTPLQKKLNSLSKILIAIVLVICVVIFAVGLIRSGDFSGGGIIDSFMLAVSLAVAAIPEGLAAVVTIVLSIGVTGMSKHNAVIRRLTAVETLGCAQVICSDKTGTLTQNKMTVVKAVGADEKLLARAMALCSDAEYTAKGAVGEPTECALVNFAAAGGQDKNLLKKEYERVAEAPFDSVRKMMSTVHSRPEGGYVQFTKGAPDELICRCTHILTSDGVVPLTDEMRAGIAAQNREMADSALRVLAAAQKIYDSIPQDTSPEALERGLTFIGLEGMTDPVRPEVKAAVERCHAAGITVVMITGDNIDTATAIARELNILTDRSQAITGSMLDDIGDEQLERDIDKYRVYARVQPEHKVRIVSAWKKRGCVTAMTGDGVNDAPSIKTADIGIGMGITGTDVTKNVADMILADDNFATIVEAVDEGRRIYDNVRKSIQFLLSSNLAEVIGIFIATMLGVTLLEPVHILWINLITDSLPALALGMENGEADAMHRPPRDPKEGVFSGGAGFDILYQGTLCALLTLAAYFIGHRIESGVWEIARSYDGITMAFLTLSMTEIFHSFNMRSRRDSVFTLSTRNKWLWGSALGALALTAAVIYVPFLRGLFKFEHISLVEYLIALGLAFLIVPIVELVKLIQRRLGK